MSREGVVMAAPSSAPHGPATRVVRGARVAAVVVALLSLTVAGLPAGASDDPDPPEWGDEDEKRAVLDSREWDAPPGVPEPVDPESWLFPEWHESWEDYREVPGVDWREPPMPAQVTFNGALVLADFADRDFLVTMPAGSDVFGLPTEEASDIPRDEVAGYYHDFLMTPNEVNQFRTIDEFWRENSYGRYGIDLEPYGPYRLEGKEHEYGLNEFGQQDWCPRGDSCDRDYMSEAFDAWVEDVGPAQAESYDFVFFINPGYDESSTWEEFGRMIFETPESVTDAFGPPDPDLPNWSGTRYVDWTSWYAAKGLWSRADIVNGRSLQSESSGQGVYAHEFSHILGVLDNYNNPFADPPSRTFTGPWANLSRGIFLGPGGHHDRWKIPANRGASAPAHHMLRNKMRLGLTDPQQVLRVERDAIAATGPIVADVWARTIPLGSQFERDGIRGINISMARGDFEPDCSIEDDYRCDQGGDPGPLGYDNYTVEVVDRMGFDSFAPDYGTLIAKTRNADLPIPFMWVIDANPETLEMVDYHRPDGSTQMIVEGDYRQIANALFKAGTSVQSEHVDEHNGLHFYVLDTQRDDDGALSYRVAVRSLEGGGPFPRGVEVTGGEVTGVTPGRVAACTFEVENTGSGAPALPDPLSAPDQVAGRALTEGMRLAASLDPGLAEEGLLAEVANDLEALRATAQPDVSGLLGQDLIRIDVDSSNPAWNTTISYDVLALARGEREEVTVYVWHEGGGPTQTEVRITATSETAPSASSSGGCVVDVRATTN